MKKEQASMNLSNYSWECPMCGGSGVVSEMVDSGCFNEDMTEVHCPHCPAEFDDVDFDRDFDELKEIGDMKMEEELEMCPCCAEETDEGLLYRCHICGEDICVDCAKYDDDDEVVCECCLEDE